MPVRRDLYGRVVEISHAQRMDLLRLLHHLNFAAIHDIAGPFSNKRVSTVSRRHSWTSLQYPAYNLRRGRGRLGVYHRHGGQSARTSFLWWGEEPIRNADGDCAASRRGVGHGVLSEDDESTTFALPCAEGEGGEVVGEEGWDCRCSGGRRSLVQGDR